MWSAKLLLFWLCAPALLYAQLGSNAPSEFAVATIKPDTTATAPLTQIQGNRFVTLGTTFVDLFKYAYNVHPGQIIGGPDWLRTERFDVIADPETEKRPTSDQMKVMMQHLLVERFHLTMHKEQRLLSVYALVRMNTEPKLKPSTSDPNGIPAVGYEPKGELDAANATMANLATFLQRFVLDRPAVDQTGIQGHYDLTLRWTPDNLSADARASDSTTGAAFPTLFTAIQEQLGLKLQPTKANTDAYIIDQAQKPVDN